MTEGRLRAENTGINPGQYAISAFIKYQTSFLFLSLKNSDGFGHGVFFDKPFGLMIYSSNTSIKTLKPIVASGPL